MKAISLIFLSLFLVIISTGFAYSAQMNLAGAWSFDEGSGKTAKDAVAGANGELKGSLSWGQGKFGNGIKFPGKGDSYVTIPHKEYMDADAYTFVAWTKLDAASYQYIAWKDGVVWPELHLKRHIDIWINNTHNPIFMWHADGGEGRLDGKKTIADSAWHHIAKWYDGKTIRMYIDGALDGEADSKGKLLKNGEDPLWIGARPGDVAATGIIDEVGFFTKALSEAELKTAMNQSLNILAAVESPNKLPTTWGNMKSGF
jgi:hypothetical protein